MDGDAPLYASWVFALRSACDETTVAPYARSCQLTTAENQVLAALCQGLGPDAIALRHDVRISTMRSQVGSILAMTQCHSIRELVHSASRLPSITRRLA